VQTAEKRIIKKKIYKNKIQNMLHQSADVMRTHLQNHDVSDYLQIVVQNNNSDALEDLIADNKLRYASVESISYAILHALEYKYERIADLLISGSEFDRMSLDDQINALNIACSKNIIGVIPYLLFKKRLNPNTLSSIDGYNALHHAVYNQHVNIVRLLLNTNMIDVNKLTNNSCSALYLASYRGNVEIVKLLLDMPGININQAYLQLHTPLCAACVKGHEAVVKILLDYGANTRVGCQNETLMNIAKQNNFHQIVMLLKPYFALKETILLRNLGVTDRDRIIIDAYDEWCQIRSAFLYDIVFYNYMKYIEQLRLLHAEIDQGVILLRRFEIERQLTRLRQKTLTLAYLYNVEIGDAFDPDSIQKAFQRDAPSLHVIINRLLRIFQSHSIESLLKALTIHHTNQDLVSGYITYMHTFLQSIQTNIAKNKKFHSYEITDGSVCPVCLASMKDINPSLWATLNCCKNKQFICTDCYAEWTRKTNNACPVCKGNSSIKTIFNK
tara:strand:- start:74 stop:1573 length:1500 start_codon:yes stop_codon:yes gene_type:complete